MTYFICTKILLFEIKTLRKHLVFNSVFTVYIELISKHFFITRTRTDGCEQRTLLKAQQKTMELQRANKTKMEKDMIGKQFITIVYSAKIYQEISHSHEPA